MKYKLPWGAEMPYEELRDLWLANTSNPNKTETAFGFWLEFKIYDGMIREVTE